MSKEKKDLESSYAHVSNGGVRATLKERIGDRNPGSSFSLEFSLSNFGSQMTVEIPVNKEMCLYLAMMLSQRLEYLESRDDPDNTQADVGMFIRFSKKEGKEIDISKEAEAFKHFAKGFEEYFKNHEVIK